MVVDCDFSARADRRCPVCNTRGRPGLRKNCPGIWLTNPPIIVPPPLIIPADGPGLEQKLLFDIMGFGQGNCPFKNLCASRMANMNLWGVDGCKKNREIIIGWLREANKETNFLEKLKAAPAALKLIPMRHWLDPIPWLVDEAIRRAAAKQLAQADQVIVDVVDPRV